VWCSGSFEVFIGFYYEARYLHGYRLQDFFLYWRSILSPSYIVIENKYHIINIEASFYPRLSDFKLVIVVQKKTKRSKMYPL